MAERNKWEGKKKSDEQDGKFVSSGNVYAREEIIYIVRPKITALRRRLDRR